MVVKPVFGKKYSKGKNLISLCAFLCVFMSYFQHIIMIITIIIIISIFKEDNVHVFSITASLPYGPPVNTDIDYYRTFFGLVHFCSVARLVMRYFVRRREASACLSKIERWLSRVAAQLSLFLANTLSYECFHCS